MNERAARPDYPAMTDAELRLARDRLGITGEHLATRLKVDPRTVRRWELGQFQIPPGVAEELAALLEEAEREADAIAATLADLDQPVLHTYRDRNEKGVEATYDGVHSFGWHRAIAARVAQRIPHVVIAYREPMPALDPEHAEQLADVLAGVYIDAAAHADPKAFLVGEIEDLEDDATGETAYPELLAEARAWTRGQAAAVLNAYLERHREGSR